MAFSSLRQPSPGFILVSAAPELLILLPRYSFTCELKGLFAGGNPVELKASKLVA